WRLRQWRVALSLAREHPITGVGLGVYPLAAAPRLPRPIPLAMARSAGPNLSLNAHNYYLQTLAEMGMVGLGLYLWTLAGSFAAAAHLSAASRRRYYRRRRADRGHRGGFASATEPGGVHAAAGIPRCGADDARIPDPDAASRRVCRNARPGNALQ